MYSNLQRTRRPRILNEVIVSSLALKHADLLHEVVKTILLSQCNFGAIFVIGPDVHSFKFLIPLCKLEVVVQSTWHKRRERNTPSNAINYRLFFISATNYELPGRRRAWAVASPLCSSWEFLMPFSPSAFYQVSLSDLTVGFLGIASDAIQLLCLAEMKGERFQVS